MSTGEYRRSARISELDARRAQKAESRNEGNRAINSRMAQGQGTRKSSDHKLARKRKTRPVHDLVDNNVEIQVRKVPLFFSFICSTFTSLVHFLKRVRFHLYKS